MYKGENGQLTKNLQLTMWRHAANYNGYKNLIYLRT